jgi:antitoxin component of RelBE/YafQ-DinJ toxin-antitoxin module
VRVPDERWDTAKWIAADQGRTMTDVINTLLEQWIRQNHPHKMGD